MRELVFSGGRNGRRYGCEGVYCIDVPFLHVFVEGDARHVIFGDRGDGKNVLPVSMWTALDYHMATVRGGIRCEGSSMSPKIVHDFQDFDRLFCPVKIWDCPAVTEFGLINCQHITGKTLVEDREWCGSIIVEVV